MSLEKFAQQRLVKELVGYRTNGLWFWLRKIATDHCLEDMDKTMPDAQPHEWLCDDVWKQMGSHVVASI